MADDKQRVNPRYAFEQLMRALGSGGEAAGRHASQWRRVLTGMFDGTLSIGSRTPVSDTPAWVTLEVAHGGFATGRYLAGGPLQEHELSKLGLIDRPAGVSERAALNAYYLGDAGRAELQKALSTGRFRLQVPEESALMVVGWLVGHNESAHADELLADISGFFGELRFYPAPHPRPSRLTTDVYLEPAQTTVERLRSVKPSAPVAAMKEAIKIWTPLYDRTVAIFLETVEGETPFLVTDKSGELTRRPDGNPIVAGGWPCRHYPDGWRTRAGELLEAYEGARSNHRLSRKPERAKENFARLRSYLAVCIKDAASLSGRDVGMIRKILASYVSAHGAPGSDQLEVTRGAQIANAAIPEHHAVAELLASRLEASKYDEGVPDADKLLFLPAASGSPTDEPAPGAIPPYLLRKAIRCLEASVDELVARNIITSSETVAAVLPAMTARIRASAIEDPELRRIYETTYSAFRRRRSLLLLDLQSQVRFEELPWIAAISQWVGDDAETRAAARSALQQAAQLTLRSFPQTILPNPLVGELRVLASTAGIRLPLVNELAADIFMGAFSGTFLRAAQLAGIYLAGSLYERYYGLSYELVFALDDLKKRPFGPPVSPGFAALCEEHAGVPAQTGWSVAENGAIIEQSQILTTHNLAALVCGLDEAVTMQQYLAEMAQRTFEWICRRQQLIINQRHAQLQNVKNSAYAWRQLIFYLAVLPEDHVDRFLDWATDHLAAQSPEFASRFEPALLGLAAVAAGDAFDVHGRHPGSGGRRLLGWTLGQHWLLTDTV